MKCIICRSENLKKIPMLNEVARWNKRKYPLFKCGECGFARPYPLPYTDESKLLVYDAEENIRFYNPKTRKIDFKSKEYQDYFKHFTQYEEFVEKYKIEGRHLDVGCGAGHIIYLISAKGMKSEGLEISKKLVNALKEKFRVHCSEIKSLNKEYELITLSHVLEHVEEVVGFARELNKHTRKNGYVILSVPYLNGIIPRVLRTKWYGLGHGQHLNFFSKKSIKKLFEDSGFEILEFKKGVLDYTYKRFPKSLNLFIIFASRLIKILNLGDNLYVVAKKTKEIK